MLKVKKLFVLLVGVLTFGGVSEASMLDQLIYNVAGQATNAVGARLGDEIYYGSSGKSSHRKSSKKHKKRRVHTPVMTDERRIQQSLTSLGFYHGRIDGQINSFESRTAIKNMNIAYGISSDSSLRQEVRDSLIYLGTLFEFDRYLIASSTSSKSKNKKIQVSLKIHGYYHSGIDGLLGGGSRNAIREYQMGSGLSATGSLDYEAEYQLISSAKEKNDRNLNDTINSLKSIGANRTAPQAQGYQQPMQQSYGQQQHISAEQGYQQRQKAPTGQQKMYQKNIAQTVAPQTIQAQQSTQGVSTQATTQAEVQTPVQNTMKNSTKTEMPDSSTIEMYTDTK